MAVRVEDQSATTQNKADWRDLLWFTGILWRASPGAVLSNATGMILQAIVPAAQLIIAQILLDQVHASIGGGSDTFRLVLPWILALIGIQALNAAVGTFRGHARAIVREKAGWNLEQLVLQSAGIVALDQYEQPEFFDRLQRAQTASIWRSFMLFETVLRVFEMTIGLVSFLVLLISGHVSVPFILALGAAPTLISHLRRGRETYSLYRQQTTEQRRTNYLVQLLTDREAAKELRLYGLGRPLTTLWEKLAHQLRDQRFRLALRQQLRLGLSRLATIIGFAAATGIMLWRAVDGAITLGVFFTLTEASNRFQNQLSQVVQTVGRVYEELLYLSDLRQFAASEPEGKPDAVTLVSEGPVRITCDDVSFAYPNGHLVLQNVSFTLNPGEKIALVGQNGAGKTTLVKLLLGLYYPTHGRILINDIDIRDIDPDSLREKCAAVFQDFLKYQLSARENIAYGQVDRQYDLPAVDHAAGAGGAKPIIESLEHGYDTRLGRYFEGGQDLSGGQWQKLAISRAYFRDAQFLVFDEPTAALDPRAELEVFRQFRSLSEGKSAVFVSHRMASARIADRILVLENGFLIENGSHAELMSQKGEYARMFELQAQWYQDDLRPAFRTIEGAV